QHVAPHTLMPGDSGHTADPAGYGRAIAAHTDPVVAPLHDLFLSDFGDLSVRLPSRPVVRFLDRSQQLEAFLFRDLYTEAEWMSFYIPSSPDTFEICEALMDSY